MIEIRIQTITYEGPARVVMPNLHPDQIAQSNALQDITDEQKIAFDGPAVVLDPLHRPAHLARLTRFLGSPAMADIFTAPALESIQSSTIIPLQTTEKSEGMGLVDDLSLIAFAGIPHIISAKNSVFYLR